MAQLHVNQRGVSLATQNDSSAHSKSGNAHAHAHSSEQARSNVVMEILHAEREYVKHLRDVIEGYVEKAQKRPEMFPEQRLQTIFCNIEEIYRFSEQFLRDLEKSINTEAPHDSHIGCCFVKHVSQGSTNVGEMHTYAN